MTCPLEIHPYTSQNTLAQTRGVRGVVYAETVRDILAILTWARDNDTFLYTVSTGHNWGYGSSLPVQENCLILNLSRMNKICDFNRELGTVTVEPGVTQSQLYQFFLDNELDYMIPTTGAGPTTSILGNALEKGYGVTPYQDHMDSVLGLEAVMPDGSIYRSTLNDFGGYRSDGVFRWKIGPYLDGLFFQSNFGIVTKMTIALARRPESIRQFFLFVNEEKFEDVVHCITKVRQTYGSLVGGINLMNRRRVLSMMDDHNLWNKSGPMFEYELRQIAHNNHITDWVVMGALYGSRPILKATERQLKKLFKPLTRRTVFLDDRKLTLAAKILRYIPIPSLGRLVSKSQKAFDVLSGKPSEIALPLAYLKNASCPPPPSHLHPDRDGCGLMWFAPLLPKDPALVRDFYQEVERVCLRYDMDPLITLTSISPRCFDSTIPLLFDKNDPQQVERVYACYDTLIEMCLSFGIFPYRMDIAHMPQYFNRTNITAVGLYDRIKSAIDPQGTLSPGRYARTRSFL